VPPAHPDVPLPPRPRQADLTPVQAAVVRDAHKSYVKATALPKELVQRIAKLETDAYVAWVEARKASDFAKFAPFLEEWVEVRREAVRWSGGVGEGSGKQATRGRHGGCQTCQTKPGRRLLTPRTASRRVPPPLPPARRA
jgi:hypothetical protein